MKKIISLFAFLLICFAIGFSQPYGSFHLGTALPISDFGSDDLSDENAIGAAIGFSAGVNFFFPIEAISVPGKIGILFGADAMYNGLKKDIKDYIKETYGYFGLDVDTYMKYINIPISVGVNYENEIID